MNPTDAGQWVKLPIGHADSYRAAGFSRWFVRDVLASGEVLLTRSYLGQQYTRIVPQEKFVMGWETCNAPKAWAP